MAFGVLALYDLRKLAGVDTDYEESCRDVFLLEDVEDFGGPAEVGPSSKVMAILLSAAPIWSML